MLRKIALLTLIFAVFTHSKANPFARMAGNFAAQKIAHVRKNFTAHAQTRPEIDQNKAPTKTILGNRPPQVQEKVNEAFKYNREASDGWLYDGAWGFYGLLNLNEKHILKNLALENHEKKDIYIIDVGCAKGKWGQHAMNILQSDEYKKSGKHFHIFSVTGGKECDELVQQYPNVTLYQLNQFKIENIDEELAKRGFDLKDKVDLMVSRWTLRHLVDSFGTLKRMYSLLTPEQGKLLSNGFLFKFNDSDKVQPFPWGNENILTHANAHVTSLFMDFAAGRDTGEFLIVRNDKNELDIPLEYTGNTHFIGDGWQNDSMTVTIYNKGALNKPQFEREFIKDSLRKKHYCDKDDQQCKNLYKHLADLGLFFADK